MKKRLVITGLLVLGGLVGIVAVSCGSDSASSPAQTSSNPYTDPVRSQTEGSSPARIAGDGRYFGYVRAVDAESRRSTLSLDVSQFFFGKDRQRAAEEDGAVAQGEPVSNDHYERNANTQAQTLAIANDVRLTAAGVSRLITSKQVQARCGSGCDWTIPVTLAEFFAAFETKRFGMTAAGIPVWVTIRDDQVVRIDEQYFP
jgi:hypothetical protein